MMAGSGSAGLGLGKGMTLIGGLTAISWQVFTSDPVSAGPSCHIGQDGVSRNQSPRDLTSAADDGFLTAVLRSVCVSIRAANLDE